MIKALKYKPLILSLVLLSSVAAALTGCKKIFDLPEEKEFLSNKINYGNKVFEPVLGRTSLMGNLNTDNSTVPLKFEIVNARYGDGRPYNDIFQVQKTYVWTAPYDGLETSLAQIEAKRKLEDHPMFEVRSSGQFIMWQSSTNDLIAPRPADSSNLEQDKRLFDLKITNVGGEIILKNFQIRPWRERLYEPSTDINPYTGKTARDPNDPKNPNKRDYITPGFNNVIGVETNRGLVNDATRKDLVVYIRPFTGGTGNSLRFKFLGKDSLPINPVFFNETKWDFIVHGFNKVMTPQYVQYDVAYPIPVINLGTKYAPSGSQARSIFSYSRRGFGGTMTTANIELNYNIFKKGDWEIVFHFRRENPKFQDE
ncbi:DUF5007 domain-containing protein [Pedobacter metabolipauper]|nr:DUF5007 domain-containing protein [Pedobacter metabolipauper]